MFLTFPEPQTAPISGAQTSPFPADMAHPARCKQKYPSRGRFSPHSGFQLERPQNHRLQAAIRLSDTEVDQIQKVECVIEFGEGYDVAVEAPIVAEF